MAKIFDVVGNDDEYTLKLRVCEEERDEEEKDWVYSLIDFLGSDAVSFTFIALAIIIFVAQAIRFFFFS